MVIDSILVKELEDARARFRQLKSEVAELESKGGKNGSVDEKAVVMERQLAEAAASLSKTQEQLAAAVRERDALIAQNTEARSAMEANRSEIAKAKTNQDASLEEANRELVGIRTQLASLGMERNQLTAELDQARNALKTEREEFHKERGQLASELEKIQNALKTEREGVQKERGQLASALDHAKKALKTEHDEFHKEKKKIESSAEGIHKELEAARKKLGTLESERNQLAGELADTKSALNASRDTLNNGQKTYAEALDKANIELAAIRAKCGELENLSDSQAVELTGARKTLTALKQEFDAAQKETFAAMNELRAKAEAAGKLAGKFEEQCKTLHANIEIGSGELAAKRSQLHKLRNEHQVLLDSNERMQREMAALKNLGTQLSAMQQERDSYAGDLKQIQAQLNESRKQAEDGQAAHAKLQEEFKAAQEGLFSLQNSIKELQSGHENRIKELQGEHENRVKELQGEHEKLAGRSVDAEKALLAVQNQLAAAGKEQAETRQALEQFKKERENSAKELSQANTMLARVQGQLDAMKLNNNELRQANESVKNELAQTREKLAAWQGDSDALEATLSNLETQLSQALKQINLNRGKSPTPA